MADKIEMIIEYTTDGADYQYCDNHGVLVRCKDCRYRLHQHDEEWCGVWSNTTVPDAYCSYGRKGNGDGTD